MRRASLTLGLMLLACMWWGPLPALAQRAFFAHMTLHMGVVALAAPLLALGIAGSGADPVRRYPHLFAPVPWSILELVVVWAWHTPAWHLAARGSDAIFVLEQGSFLAVGVLLWLSVFGGSRPRSRSRSAAGIIGLLLTTMHMTLLGALLALTPRALYHEICGVSGLTPLEDQHIGGALMLIVGSASYLFGALWLTASMLRQGDLGAGEVA